LRPEFFGATRSAETFNRYLLTTTLDDWLWNAAQFNKIGELTDARGLTFGYHNHSIEFRPVGNVVPFDQMLARTEPRYVAFEMDVGWVESARASAVTYLRGYPGRFQLLHIKDIKHPAEPGRELTVISTEVGRGVIDWKPIFAEAPRAGVRHYFIEQEPPFERPPFESVRLSYDWMRSVT
jgi:sugar phosphate isomerase/epimerase